MTALFHNNAASTLALQAQLIDTVLTVSAGTGNRFPAPAATEWFFATIQSGVNYEIVKCTARAGDVLTVVRAQDGTSARLWSAGASIDMRIPKIVLESFLQEIADTAVTTAKLADTAVTTAKLAFDGGALSGSRNRIINGDMRIDQRNNGAGVTLTSNQFLVDRWKASASQASKFSAQQNAGSVTPPPGFTNYLGITSLTAYAVAGNDSFMFETCVEGFNLSDLNWGGASALPATLSFWVRSSLTGTFGGSLATTRTAIWVMPFSFTISAANTWTYVTVPVTAPIATGGANTDNSEGVFVRFGLGGIGTSVGGTPGVWTNSGNFRQPNGTVSVVGTNGATFYITGIQLEQGTVATPFERRQIGQELALCQRYYWKLTGTTSMSGATVAGLGYTALSPVAFPVTMRSAPTVNITSSGSRNLNSIGIQNVSSDGFLIYGSTNGAATDFFFADISSATASAEL